MQVTPVRWRDLFRRQIYNNQPYFIKPQIFAQKRALCITRSIHLPTVTGYISPFYYFIFQSLQLLRAPLSSGFHCSCHLAAGSPSPFMLLLPPASAPPPPAQGTWPPQGLLPSSRILGSISNVSPEKDPSPRLQPVTARTVRSLARLFSTSDSAPRARPFNRLALA